MFTFEVNKNEIRMTEFETVTSGSVDVYDCQFTFSSDWDGLVKTITFRAGDVSVSILLDSTNICSIPWEVMQEDAVELYCGVRGTVTDTDTEEEAIIPTVYCLLGTIRKGTELGDNAQPPVPSVVDQIMNRIEALDEGKQDKLTGQPGQVVSFDEYGNVISRAEKGTEYKAGENISISEDNTISAAMYNDTEIREEILSVKTATDKNSAEIVKNAGAIADSSEAIVKNTADISKNTEEITANTEAIAKNTADISKNTDDIARVSKLADETAATAASNAAAISTINDNIERIDKNVTEKQNKLTAGENISISADNVISAVTYDDTEIRNEIAAHGEAISKNAKAIADNSEAITQMRDDINAKQNKLVGQAGQVVGFDENGNAIAQDGGTGTPGKDGTTFTPMVSPEGIISWTNDGGKENPEAVNIKGGKGDRGVTFTPTVSSEGVISWTNDGGLDNPDPVNIKGTAGTYTAGENISISEDNVISAAAYDDTEIREEIHNVKTTVDVNTEAIAKNASEITRVETFAEDIAATTAANTNAISAINDSVATIDTKLNNKQDKLTAGDNVHIEGNVISSDMYDDTAIRSSISSLTTNKQDKLTAGDNVHIEGNVISSDMYDDTAIRGEISAQSTTISEHSTSINANTTAISAINDTLANKQNKLTAGDNIHISVDNVISSDMYDDTAIRNAISSQGKTISEHSASINNNAQAIQVINNTLTNKQDKLTGTNGQVVVFNESGNPVAQDYKEGIEYTAGNNIIISNNKISSNTGITRKAISITGAGTTLYANNFTISTSSVDLYEFTATGNESSGGAFSPLYAWRQYKGHATITCTTSTSSISRIYLLSQDCTILSGKAGYACGFAKISYTPYNQSLASTVLKPVATYRSGSYWGFVIESSLSIDNTKPVDIEIFFG